MIGSSREAAGSSRSKCLNYAMTPLDYTAWSFCLHFVDSPQFHYARNFLLGAVLIRTNTRKCNLLFFLFYRRYIYISSVVSGSIIGRVSGARLWALDLPKEEYSVYFEKPILPRIPLGLDALSSKICSKLFHTWPSSWLASTPLPDASWLIVSNHGSGLFVVSH